MQARTGLDIAYGIKQPCPVRNMSSPMGLAQTLQVKRTENTQHVQGAAQDTLRTRLDTGKGAVAH